MILNTIEHFRISWYYVSPPFAVVNRYAVICAEDHDEWHLHITQLCGNDLDWLVLNKVRKYLGLAGITVTTVLGKPRHFTMSMNSWIQIFGSGNIFPCFESKNQAQQENWV